MIYIELKNGVVLPTRFPDANIATKVLNDIGSFIEINGQSYNKFEIKRTFEMKEHPILIKMSQQPYHIQEALRAIAKQRQTEGKKIASYEQLMSIYQSDPNWKYGNSVPFYFQNNDATLHLDSIPS